MGTIVFISSGLGSILLGGLMDQHGRKFVLFRTLLVAPIVHLMWLVYPSLLTIYFGLFLLGFQYSIRSSCTYVYTTESLLSKGKL